MADAKLEIPNGKILEKVIRGLNDKELSLDNREIMGDVYEYLLVKLSVNGTNGQFRTPRHIISMMVQLMLPIELQMSFQSLFNESTNQKLSYKNKLQTYRNYLIAKWTNILVKNYVYASHLIGMHRYNFYSFISAFICSTKETSQFIRKAIFSTSIFSSNIFLIALV